MKTIVTVLVLTVWAACTAHCAIENLSGAAELPCCHEEGGQSDRSPAAPGHCVCSAIQAGGYVSPDSALSIPLPCDAVLRDPAAPGQETLEYLEHANLFIVPLDNERRWYRYHHLFADLLRQRLHQNPPPLSSPSMGGTERGSVA